MKLDEAIEQNNKKIIDLKARSAQAMATYQVGTIGKELHNSVQSEINKDVVSTELGIEALEKLKGAREMENPYPKYDGETDIYKGRRNGFEQFKIIVEQLLPSETES